MLYVVTIGHVALWVEDKKQENKQMKESRMKIAQQTQWKNDSVIQSVEVDYEDDLDYDDFFNDEPYNLTYDGIQDGLVCCPRKAELKDCCCHWSRSGNARATALSKVTSHNLEY